MLSVEANFNLVTPKYVQANRLWMALQKELSEKATAVLIFSAAFREVSMSKDINRLVGALSNEPL